MILIYHASRIMGAGKAFTHGYLSVDFFFMLSGFVLAHAYQARLAAGVGAGVVLMRRAVRLWPMIAAGTLVGFVAAIVTGHAPLPTVAGAALGALFVLPTGVNPAIGFGVWSIDTSMWSLFWEFVAALIFAAGGWRSSRGLLRVIVVTAALGLTAAALRYGSLDIGYLPEHALGGGIRLLFAFTTGMVLQRADRGRAAARMPAWRPCAFLVALLAVPPFLPSQLLDPLIVIGAFPILLKMGIEVGEAGAVWRWAGDLSYPVYTIHWPLIVLIEAMLPLPPGWPGVAVAIGITIGTAVLVERLLDRPARRWLAVQSSRFCGSSTSSPSTSRNQWRVTAEMGRPS